MRLALNLFRAKAGCASLLSPPSQIAVQPFDIYSFSPCPLLAVTFPILGGYLPFTPESHPYRGAGCLCPLPVLHLRRGHVDLWGLRQSVS